MGLLPLFSLLRYKESFGCQPGERKEGGRGVPALLGRTIWQTVSWPSFLHHHLLFLIFYPAMSLISFLAFSAAVTALAGPSVNPFAGQDFYVNPAFVAEISSSIASCRDPTACANLKIMRDVSSALD